MQTPRPKQASAPDQQSTARENRTSSKGASAPLVVSGGQDANKQTGAKPSAGTKPPVDGEPTAVTADLGPAVIVFGLNENRIPQAAWFPASEAALATQAARLMGLRVLKVDDETHRQIAARLRQGQVYASDRTFAPAVVRDVFDTLCQLAEPVAGPSPLDVTAASTEAASRPANWNEIQVGSLVLAHDTADGEVAWWEAIVMAIESEQFVLRWRDFARQPCVRRSRSDVALLPLQAA